ncbi:bifunctional protein-serine/threonine kinase/phosphatase [Rhodoblastus sp.]|uniref:bifunctional protein-serine/threonine kinase/phosphatase n=1 Tax=Rhodoblastus sp. TaxID=1962975 RepID=UPI0035AE3DFD
MTSSPDPLVSAGWTLSLGMARATMAATEFHVAARGEDCSAPRRGLAAVVTEGDEAAPAAAEAAQIAGRLFIDGYFGALATLSPARAATQSLTSANDWLFRQSGADPLKGGMAASLVAVLAPAGKSVAILHLGANRIYLRRDGAVRRLTRDHLRPLAPGAALTRAVGLDTEAHAELTEIEARPGDLFVLVSAALARGRDEGELTRLLLSDLAPQELTERLVESLGQGTAAALAIVATPAPQAEDLASDFARLPVRPPPHEGDVLDGFLIGRTLYRGRYTLLKRARDTIGQRDIVLKLPLPAMAQDPVFQAGFLREAWIGTRLRSRWTVDYLDVPPGRRDSLYLVMPFYRGETLDARLTRAPPVSLAEGAGVALSLCEAIADLSTRQIVHRDIKPENIFLLEGGDIKLLDFGLAALPGLDDPDADSLGGTTRYMAPELFRGVAASESSEVFSLGVTLYRMFSGGAFPFGRREAVPLARARPDLPRWLGATLGRALETDPARRYPDAAALREALLYGLAHEDWSGPPVRRREWGLAFWRAAAGLLALACLLLILARR